MEGWFDTRDGLGTRIGEIFLQPVRKLTTVTRKFSPQPSHYNKDDVLCTVTTLSQLSP